MDRMLAVIQNQVTVYSFNVNVAGSAPALPEFIAFRAAASRRW